MSKFIPAAIWRAHLLTLRNILHFEKRMRLALLFSLIFGVTTGIWSTGKLTGLLQHWQQQGTTALDTGLWLYCLSTWSGMSAFAALGILQALESAEITVLFTLPIPPAMRFRILIATFFLKNLWLWFLLQVLLLSSVFISVLGWQALTWLIVLQLGVVACICITLLVALFLLRYLWPGGTLKGRCGIVVGSGFFLLLCALCLPALIGWVLEIQPWLVSLLFLLILLLMMGPFATACGRCYEVTFFIVQNRDRARRPLMLPGMQVLQQLFARQRTLMGALYSRAVINQGRNIFFWIRLVLIWSALAFFPWLHSMLQRYGFANALLVVGYTAALVLGHILETAPGALSSEGNRLALYLTAPFSLTQLLLAKWAQILFPILIEGLSIALLLSCWLTLPIIQIVWIFAVLVLIIVSATTLLVWGSAWDTDLNLNVEGLMETIIHEEALLTPRKMILFNLCIVLLAAILLLLWKMPASLALIMLILLTGSILMGMWYFAQAQLRGLLQHE